VFVNFASVSSVIDNLSEERTRFGFTFSGVSSICLFYFLICSYIFLRYIYHHDRPKQMILLFSLLPPVYRFS
jgi:hypothetical protein